MNAEQKPAAKPKKEQKLNPEILWLVAIFLLAVVLRTVAVLMRDMIVFNETSFVRMASNLLAGHPPYDITGSSASHNSILYPLIIASIEVMTRSVVPAAYIVSVLFSSLLILPTYLFGKVMWNMRVGRAAAVLVAVLPVLVANGSIIDGQNMFAFWLLCALFFGYRMQFTKRCMCGMLSGTCLGIAYLDDPSALFYLVTLFALLVIVGFRQELSNYANKAATHFVLLFLAFAIPYVAFMTWQNGTFTINDRPNDQVYAVTHNLPQDSIERDQVMMSLDANGELKLDQYAQGPGLIRTFFEDPVNYLKTVAKRDYNFFLQDINSLIPVWLLPLAGLGLFKYAWTRREALKYGYFALVMSPLLVLPLAWSDTRFALPYLGIVMLWVARGWVYLEEWSAESIDEIAGWKGGEASHKRQVQTVLALLVLVPLAVMSIWNVQKEVYPTEFRIAGQWLSAQGLGDARIMSREPSTAWYAGGTQVIMPYASVDETLKYAQAHDTDYLVMSRRATDLLRPQLEPLMNETSAYANVLEPVYHTGQGTDIELIVYRVKQS